MFQLVIIKIINLFLIKKYAGPFPAPGQLHTMKSPFPGRGSRSPLHFPLFPLNCQRRWSEAAAVEASGDHTDNQMRRWSMPWDTSWCEGSQSQQRYLPTKLIVPTAGSDRSRSTTPGMFSESEYNLLVGYLSINMISLHLYYS